MKKNKVVIFLTIVFLFGNGCRASREGFFISSNFSESTSTVLKNTNLQNFSDAAVLNEKTTTSTIVNTQKNNGWKKIVDKQSGYELEYPYFLEKLSFLAGEQYEPYIQAWEFPKTQFKGTNLSSAIVVFQKLAENNSTKCLRDYFETKKYIENFKEEEKPLWKVSEINKNTIKWHRAEGTDGGAGNFYEQVTYESFLNTTCYRWHLELHSINTDFTKEDNANITYYDSKYYVNIFEEMVNRFNPFISLNQELDSKVKNISQKIAWKKVVDKNNKYEFMYPDFLEKGEGAELYPWYNPAIQDWKFPTSWIKDTNLSLAGIILQVLPDLNERECLKEYNLFQKNFEQDKKEKININGLDWYYTKTQFVTLGKIHERINYEVMKNNTCYHLYLYLDSKNIDTLDLKEIKEFNREQYISIFKKIINSFNIISD